MKDIVYTVEMFQWHKTDQLGNTQVEIRDKNHMTVFYMRIVGREYLESKRFQEELAPLVVDLLNICSELGKESLIKMQQSVMTMRAGIEMAKMDSTIQNAPISNGNNVLTAELPKRRGRPPKVKV
mgnify:FL=1